MTDQSLSFTLTVSQSPAEVYAAINTVRGWWSGDIEGSTDTLGSVFNYKFQDLHRCTIKITELIPGKRVAWHVVSNYFSFTEDETEWTGTDITFDISSTAAGTQLHFVHHGLVPTYECYEACSDGWGTYINISLRNLIITGAGQPNAGEAMTDSERRLLA